MWAWTRTIPTRQRPLWFALACGSAVALLAGNDLWREHKALIASAGQQTETLTRVLAAQTQEHLASIALELQQIDERVDNRHDGFQAFVDDMVRVLHRRPASAAIRAFVVVDATGRVQAVQGDDAAARIGSTMASRDFFKHLSTDNAPRLSIGQPLQRADG